MTDLAFFRATMPESSALATGADDALKDLDNTWFLRGQPDDVRAAWFDRTRILRLVDRLAEYDREHHGSDFFGDFWRQLLHCRKRGAACGTMAFGKAALAAARIWDGRVGETWTDEALSAFFDGLHIYCLRAATVLDLRDHERMLSLCSGEMFRLFPYVEERHAYAIRRFGELDGFFNNLRDLAEDSAAGLCYFPADALERHGLTRDDVLTGRCIGTVGWERMMTWWLDDYLPTLRERAAPFIEATGLHPSLEALRSWCLHRYRRVESVFREVGYDYLAFQVLYWARVREELAERSEAA